MRRRDFIKVISGAAAAWPFVARAQRPALPVVGFLNSASAGQFAGLVRAFKQGLAEVGSEFPPWSGRADAGFDVDFLGRRRRQPRISPGAMLRADF
jgi:hypothetical protein